MKKSPAEIAMIQNVYRCNSRGSSRRLETDQSGFSEYQVAATMTETYFDRGVRAARVFSYRGTGTNAAVLALFAESQAHGRLANLVLMDVAAECGMYATDITRTVPVNGKFTPRQRELYQVVLGAQNAAIAAIKPGVVFGNRLTKNGLQKIAADYIDTHGKDLKGKSLGQYFIHSLGHHVGLDVHDPYDPTLPLEAGMIITMEPGVYIPEENIGIRIEDVVLVTENGAKILSSSLPREVNEIEKAMGR